MATRYYSFAEQEFYHIYNRGNSKQQIFKSVDDYTRFKKALYLANNSEPFVLRELNDIDVFELPRSIPLVHIGAYCCMPNHFHLLITPVSEGGVSKFMSKLATSYSSYFNKKYDRTGSLFEGPYKAKHITSDRYLKYLFAYIHLNPYRIKEFKTHQTPFDLATYQHSSLPDYLGQDRAVQTILSKEKFPHYFIENSALRSELNEWLTYGEQ